MKKKRRSNLKMEDIKQIVQNFNIGSVKSFKAISSGHQSDNYKITTEKGTFVVKLFYNSQINAHNFERILSIHEYLANHGILVPKPQRAKTSRFKINYKGNTVGVMSFLDGKHPKVMNAKLLSRIGFELGRSDRLLMNYRPIGKLSNPAEFLKKLKKKRNLDDIEVNELYKKTLKQFSEAPIKKLSISTINGDPSRSNFMICKKRIAIVDYGASRRDFLLSDIAFSVLRFGLDKGDHRKYKAFIDGYTKGSLIKKWELKYLPAFLRVARMIDTMFSYPRSDSEKTKSEHLKELNKYLKEELMRPDADYIT